MHFKFTRRPPWQVGCDGWGFGVESTTRSGLALVHAEALTAACTLYSAQRHYRSPTELTFSLFDALDAGLRSAAKRDERSGDYEFIIRKEDVFSRHDYSADVVATLTQRIGAEFHSNPAASGHLCPCSDHRRCSQKIKPNLAHLRRFYGQRLVESGGTDSLPLRKAKTSLPIPAHLSAVGLSASPGCSDSARSTGHRERGPGSPFIGEEEGLSAGESARRSGSWYIVGFGV